MKNQITTAPITASSDNDVEFVDSPGAFRRFCLRRTYLYELERQGLIHGVSLRKKGALKGKKLWVVASIRAYLAEQMENRGAG